MIEKYKILLDIMLASLNYYGSDITNMQRLGDEIGVKKPDLSKIINNKKKDISIDTHRKFASFLGISVSQLLDLLEKLDLNDIYFEEIKDNLYMISPLFNTPYFQELIKKYESKVLKEKNKEAEKTLMHNIKRYFNDCGYKKTTNPTHLKRFSAYIKNDRISLIFNDLQLDKQEEVFTYPAINDNDFNSYRHCLLRKNKLINTILNISLYPEISDIYFVCNSSCSAIAKYFFIKMREIKNLNINLITYEYNKTAIKDKYIFNGIVRIKNNYQDFEYYANRVTEIMNIDVYKMLFYEFGEKSIYKIIDSRLDNHIEFIRGKKAIEFIEGKIKALEVNELKEGFEPRECYIEY